MLVDNFADLLPLVRALSNQRAVRAEKVLKEELVEFMSRAVVILVNPTNEHFSEQHGVGEGAVDGAQAAKED